MGDGAELPSANREAGEDHAGGDSRNEDAVRSVQAADMNECRFVEGSRMRFLKNRFFSRNAMLYIMLLAFL